MAEGHDPDTVIVMRRTGSTVDALRARLVAPRRAAGTGGPEWRERALAGAATALKERERDDRDDEIARLKSKVGERRGDALAA
jgi:hypothetical protein